MLARGRLSCARTRPSQMPICEVCAGWCSARRHILSKVVCTVPGPTRGAVAEDPTVHRVRLIRSVRRPQHARTWPPHVGHVSAEFVSGMFSTCSGFKCSLSSVVRATVL